MFDRKALTFLLIQCITGSILLVAIFVKPIVMLFGQPIEMADILYLLAFPVLYAAIHFKRVHYYLSLILSLGFAAASLWVIEDLIPSLPSFIFYSTAIIIVSEIIYQVSRWKHDISIENQRLQDQLLHSQKMQAVGELTAGIAHNFNNLLSIMVTNIETAKYHSNPLAERRLNGALVAGKRASELIHTMLGFSRQVTGEKDWIDLYSIIDEVVRLCKLTFDVRIEIDLQSNTKDDTVPLFGDTSQLYQMVLNFCVNARDALTPRLDEEEQSYIRINVCEETVPDAEDGSLKDWIVLSVKDNGIGMDADTLAHMYEPFFTRNKANGTGLGLSTVYGIIQEHGGCINCQSNPGEGTEFIIHLPKSVVDVEQPPVRKEPAHTSVDSV